MKETLTMKQQILSRQAQLLQEKIDRLEEQKTQILGKKDRLQFEINKLEGLETSRSKIKKKLPDQQTESEVSLDSDLQPPLLGDVADWAKPVHVVD